MHVFPLLILGFFLGACSKEEPMSNFDNIKETALPKAMIDPSNPNNSLDTSGAIHNDQLILFVDNFLLKGHVHTLDDVIDYFKADYEMAEFISNYANVFPNDPRTFDSTLAAFHNDNPIFHEYFIETHAVASNTGLNLEQKLNAIRTYENNFRFDDYPIEIAESLKVISSIARYSLHLWAPSSEGGLGYFDKVILAKDKEKLDWWEVGVNDILGAAIGGMTTANPLIGLGYGVFSSGVTIFLHYTY